MNGIITIFDDELAALKDYSLVDDIIKLAGGKFFRGRLNEQNIIFTHIAPSPLEAALAAQLMIDHFAVRRLFFSGAAVPLAPYINNGDIVIANYFIESSEPGDTVMFESDETMLTTIRTVCTAPRDGRNPHIFGAMLNLSPEAIDHPRTKSLQREFGVIASDNAGAAFAYACNRNNLPFAVIDIAAGPEEIAKKNIADKYHSSILDLFEIKGLTLVELTVSALTADL